MVIICVLFLPNKAVEKDKPFRGNPLLNNPKTHEEAEAKLLDPNDGETESPGYTFVYFATRPAVIAVGLTLAFHSATTVFIDVALAAYLLEKFAVGGDSSGFYFFIISWRKCYLFPFLGWLVDRGQAGFFSSLVWRVLWGLLGYHCPVQLELLRQKIG